MQKKFLFTARIENDKLTISGKIFLFGLDEFVFEGLPEDKIYFSLKKENGAWLQTHGHAHSYSYIDQLGEQIDVFFDGAGSS